MAKQSIPQDDLRELLFPYGGLNLVQPSYLKGNPGTCEIGENVVFFETFTGRGRGGSRSGLTRAIDEQVSGDHEIQHIGGIVTIDGEMINWSFDGPDQQFPGIYAGIGFIDFDFVPLIFPSFLTSRSDGNPLSETFTIASGYPQVNDKKKNEKIVTTILPDVYEEVVGTNVRLVTLIRDRNGVFLSALALDGKNIVLHTDPPNADGDNTLGGAGGSELQTLVTSTTARKIFYWATVVSDIGNIVSTSKTTHIRFTKALPVISWSNPASISQGTPLSGTQLNATAGVIGIGPVSGTFVYNPPSGTVLAQGDDQILSVHFTPDDTTTYETPADKTVEIDVTASGGELGPLDISAVRSVSLASPSDPDGVCNLELDIVANGTITVIGKKDPGTVALPNTNPAWGFVADDSFSCIFVVPDFPSARLVGGTQWYYYLPPF